MGIVHLHLKSSPRKTAILPLRMKVHAGVGFWKRHDIQFQFEILEVVIPHVTDIEQVRTRTEHDNLAIFDLEGFGIFVGFPAFEAFSVKQGNPTFILLGREQGHGKECRREKACSFHRMESECHQAKTLANRQHGGKKHRSGNEYESVGQG
jgi:hypothetical protein